MRGVWTRVAQSHVESANSQCSMQMFTLAITIAFKTPTPERRRLCHRRNAPNRHVEICLEGCPQALRRRMPLSRSEAHGLHSSTGCWDVASHGRRAHGLVNVNGNSDDKGSVRAHLLGREAPGRRAGGKFQEPLRVRTKSYTIAGYRKCHDSVGRQIGR